MGTPLMAKFALACTSVISSSVLVRCLLFPTLQLFRCFPAEPGTPSRLRMAQRRAYHGPPSMSRHSLDFSRRALATASKGCCEIISASGVRSIPGATTSRTIDAAGRQGLARQ
jgi:hypothetical protein